MAIRLNYNPMSVLTNANLSRTDRMMSRTLDHLSSGERIRRSADDPAAMVVANAVRYSRRGIERAGNNAEEAVTMLQTAEGGMDQITQVLQRMRALALNAANEATQDPSQLKALQQDLDQAVKSITTIATTTTFGGVSLLDGSLADVTLSDDAKEVYTALKADSTSIPGGVKTGSTLTIGAISGPMQRTSQTELFGPGTPGGSPVGGPGTMTITGPKGTTVIAIPASATIETAVSAINAATSITGVMAGYDDVTGNMTMESTSYGSGLISATSDIGGFLVQTPVPGVDQIVQIQYTDSNGASQTVNMLQDITSPNGRTFSNTDGGPEIPPGPYTGYQPKAFSLTIADTSGGGIGATILPPAAGLTGQRTSTTAFQLGSLASQRTVVEIADMRAGALGHSANLAASGFASLQDLILNQALVNGNSTEALQVIDAALAEVNRTRGQTGSLQGNTVERVMESLGVTGDNLAQFESILRDVDMAAESAQFARIQVMIQAATAMLAQANQVPQSVLQLLR